MNDMVAMDVADTLQYLPKQAPDLIYLVVQAFPNKVTNCLGSN